MLQLGNIGLTLAEQRVQFSMWAIMAAPLLIATDLGTLMRDDPFHRECMKMLLNNEVRPLHLALCTDVFRPNEYPCHSTLGLINCPVLICIGGCG